MKKKVMLLLSLSFMLGLGAFAQDVEELPVKTIKGISVAMNGADTVAVFGITEAYGNTEDSFKALACVVPKLEILEAGVCYSTNDMIPTIENSHIYAFDTRRAIQDILFENLISGVTYNYSVGSSKKCNSL